ncbi:MAG: SWIM zinc finger family protein, partial [Pseudomonadales bacterium]|nr:SWIM zinc finger family protein [Pseudomonadales bacterium]
MLPLFDSSDIISACSSTYSQRGRSYQQTGRVLKVTLDPIDEMLFSVVEGSYEAEYHQRIILRPPTQKKQHITIEGSCSCPVGGNCKHVAAALFEYLENQPRTSHSVAADHTAVLVSQLDAWQEIASTSSQRTKQPQAPNTQDHVIYLLQINTDQATPEITVDTVKCRKLKKGGWGKPGKVNLERVFYDYNLPAYITLQDEDIFHRLLKENQYGYSANVPLLGDDGTLTLRRLIDTQRCYLRDHVDKEPIFWGPSIKASFSWQEGDEHQLITSLPGVSNNWLYLPLDPPYYLDIDTSTCGIIESELETNDFLLLQQLPPIPPEQLYAFSRFLYQRFKSIPTPIELVFRKHEGAPTPVLTLTGTKHSNGFIHLASLQFAYGDCIVSPHAVHHQFDLYATSGNGDEWHIESDIDAEQHAISQLIELGLTETGVSTQTPETLEWFFSAESRSDSAARWHHFLEEDIATLEELGWRIDRDDHFAM